MQSLNNSVKRRFVNIFESVYGRYTNGGFLVGDVVVFKPKALSHPDFESNEELRQKIKALINGGLNLRLVNIKNNFPLAAGGNNDNNIIRRGALADVAQEITPGSLHNYVTVPLEVLTTVAGIRAANDQDPEKFNEPQKDNNLPEVRDKVIYKARINIKPKPVEKPSEDNEMSVGYQTMKSDQGGNKNVAGDRTLNNKNTPIPSSPDAWAKSPASYTAHYLPKNVIDHTKVK